MKVSESFAKSNSLHFSPQNAGVFILQSVFKGLRKATSSHMRVIVVEDHLDLRQVFIERLLNEGFDVVGATCGEELDERMGEASAQLVILDVNLPGESGFDIAQRLRAAHPGIHIIILSARTSEEDRIRGYQSGVDFYLNKPISSEELSAATKAVQRRLQNNKAQGVEFVLEASAMTIASANGKVDLSKADVAFLKALALAPENRLPYWRLYEVTEREANDAAKGQLEIQVHRLRKKLAEIDIPETLIKSIRLEGYQLTQALKIED